MSDLLPQTVNGLVNGGLYALLALGLAVIFGMLRVVNFAHGAFFMLGAFGAYAFATELGLPFWVALVAVPLLLGVVGMGIERAFVHRLARLDPLYNFLFTFGLTLIVQDAMKWRYGVGSSPYQVPRELDGALNFGSFDFPRYRLFAFAMAVVACTVVWYLLTRSRIGMVIRAATERPELTRALGINVGRWVTPVFGFGIALAGFAGVLAAPIQAVNPLMGSDLIIVVFAVVVIGGLGSIFGSVTAGFVLGVLGAWAQTYAPPIVAQTLVFILMAVVMLWRPAGLFGREEAAA